MHELTNRDIWKWRIVIFFYCNFYIDVFCQCLLYCIIYIYI